MSVAAVVRNRSTWVVHVGLILLLPWAWVMFFVPAWVSAVCGGLWALALFLALRFYVAPALTRHRAGEESLTTEEILAMRAPAFGAPVVDPRHQKDLLSLHGRLGRWQESSSSSKDGTAHAKEGVTEVISQTENAVLALTLSFRGITTKTRQQMDTAMALLKRDASEINASPGAWLSLPDYIRAYEVQLQEVIESMVKFSAASDEMVEHQKKIRHQSVLIDELLDELRSMAIRIGRLALDSSVAAGESGKNREHLVTLTDSIREISDQTHGLTRTVRQSLETIRDELGVIHKVINGAALIANESAQRAKADVVQLNVTMIEKTKEVEESLAKISSLGQAIQQDVNNAIVAMQFQDITQQKLEHMRGSLLEEVMRNLDTLSVETQEMMKKDVFLAMQAEVDRLSASPGGGPQQAPGRSSGAPATQAPASAGGTRAVDKVELF